MIKTPRHATHAHHILPTSANLLGFTFLILTSIRGLGFSKTGVIAEATGFCLSLFAISSLLSFLSIRSNERITMINYEKWAEWIFLLALIICALLSILVVLNVV